MLYNNSIENIKGVVNMKQVIIISNSDSYSLQEETNRKIKRLVEIENCEIVDVKLSVGKLIGHTMIIFKEK